MKKLLNSIIDIRPGEYKITFLLLANIYLILLTYYFLKPARDSLFLVEFGAGQLPYVFILTALIIVPITSLYSRASNYLKLGRLINYTNVILIFCLLGLRYLMTMQLSWVPYLFYIWVSIYGVLVTAQFWVLANAVYTATQAKRLFSLLGFGAILGAWTGGEITSIAIKNLNVSTENLLIFCIGFLLISIFLTTMTWNMKKYEIGMQSKKNKKKAVQNNSILRMFSVIRDSKHLMLISGIMSLTMIVASIVDFQFKALSTIAFTDNLTGQVDKSAITAFLGTFYGRLSLVSVIIQILFAQRILKVIGVGGVILFLPIGLLLGSVAMIASVGLASAIILKGTNGVLKYSLDKTGRELLFLPIPIELKAKTKIFIDMFVDRISRGISGGLLLILIAVFSFDTNPAYAIKQMSIIVTICILIWIVLAIMARKEYVSTFRTAIEKRQINLDEIRLQINESSTIETLIGSLLSSNERENSYALDMLVGVKNDLLIDPLKKLLHHDGYEVRLKALRLLIPIDRNPILDEIKEMIDDDNSSIRIEAMHYMLVHTKEDSSSMISYYLNHEKIVYQVVAMSCIAKYGDESLKELVKENHIIKFLNDKSSKRIEIHRLTAKALGSMQNREFRKYFKVLLSDSSSIVATEAIRSIGQLQDEDYIYWLLKRLSRKKNKYEAKLALAAFDNNIVEVLENALNNEEMGWEIRENIPSVLNLIHNQAAIDVLIGSLENAPPRLMYHIIKALNKCKVASPEFDFHDPIIIQSIKREIRYYYELSEILLHRNEIMSPESLLFNRALREKMGESLERVFRLLGLLYPSKDIYSAYYSIDSNNVGQKASAVEFLENLINKRIRKYFIPILDEGSLERIVGKGQELYGIKRRTLEESLIFLMNNKDPWLKALAIYNSKGLKSDAILCEIKKHAFAQESIVRETVEYVLYKHGNIENIEVKYANSN